ncbi:MAG: LUD domain-containing protein [Desulfovibrionaceae bacterium]|nr:LUD domain-containing protein [Desulfovibrionaceae bacterium]
MHSAPASSSEYHKRLDEALHDEFLRRTLDTFAVSYRESRAQVFKEVDERGLIKKIADAKDYACQHMDELYEQFKGEAEKRGVQVHIAKDAEEARHIIAQIARKNNVKYIVKSKSMTAEEIELNPDLERQGFVVDETDLGEWIIQLRHEGPSHMVMPAIHLSRYQVADVFEKETGEQQDREDIQRLVKVARVQLRRKFIAADMGVSGANFAVAENGAIATVTNEGNARMVTTLPRVHVALAGLDKLIPTLDNALTALLVLPRNATAQRLTSYVTWICGANECKSAKDNTKVMHVVFLDNGRREIAKDPLFKQIFRCVRCGACANVCPVFRLVGGHKMGYIYIGAIGLILTYFFHGKDKAKILCQNCIGCESCANVCAGGIELPRLIREIRSRLTAEENSLPGALMSTAMKNRKVFHSLLKFASFAQKPFTGGTQFQRHLPAIFLGKHGFKALPAIADKAFRDIFPKIQPKPTNAVMRVALFAGCAQDFIYPEELEACVKLLAAKDVAIDFPMEQTCCGLPLEMMGQRVTSKDVARQNINAFAAGNYDAIITLCASCASHLKHAYPTLFDDDPEMSRKAKAFSEKVIDYSSFVHDKLGVTAADFTNSGEKVTYHASCHLCRGLKVHDAPRELIADAANYVPCNEEEVCCGFGGTYSAKFPEISAQLLEKKLNNIAATGASRVVVDCPGCVMQIKGGVEKRKLGIKVQHMSELLAETMKK